MYIDKEELIELLKEKYGDLQDDRGCSTSKGNWLSIKQIINIIEDCTEYED